MIREVRAFEGGYCRQLLATVDRRSLRLVRFHAVFVALRHDREGWILVDTGYGDQFRAATAGWPSRLYRWATPATSVQSTRAQLEQAGISAADVRHVIITHFHADHIGGLADFPQATVHYRADALQPLVELPPFRQVRAAFLPSLVPGWLPDRTHVIPLSAFDGSSAALPFPGHDLFGDGSLRLLALPGHAHGHVGVAFAGPHGRELYAVDAYWRRCQIQDGIEPLKIAMALQWNAAEYRETVRRLRDVAGRREYRVHACHDEGTCARLNGVKE